MMSGHSTNPIFFNKKIKTGRPEHLLTPPPPRTLLRSITSHFCLSPPLPSMCTVTSFKVIDGLCEDPIAAQIRKKLDW